MSVTYHVTHGAPATVALPTSSAHGGAHTAAVIPVTRDDTGYLDYVLVRLLRDRGRSVDVRIYADGHGPGVDYVLCGAAPREVVTRQERDAISAAVVRAAERAAR